MKQVKLICSNNINIIFTKYFSIKYLKQASFLINNIKYKRKGMAELKTVLIIIKIEAGLGDVNWGINLIENLQETYNTTLMFVNCMKRQNIFLKSQRKYEIKEVKLTDVFNSPNKILILDSNVINNKEIEKLTSKFDKILNFHIDKSNLLIHPNIINFDEYGKYSDELRILFRDFFKVYTKGLYLSNGILKINLSPLEFKEYYNLTDEEFNLEKMTLLSKSKFYFSYFANLSLIHETLTFFYFLKNLTNISKYDKFTILTNFDFSRLVINEIYKDIETLLKEEKLNCGFSDNYYKYYYIKQMGEFKLRKNDHNQLEIRLEHKTICILSYTMLNKFEYDFLLLKSEEVIGCTGDISISEGISTNRLFLYQTLSHKLNFRNILNSLFNDYTRYKNSLLLLMFDPCFLNNLTDLENFEEIKRDWREFVISHLMKTDFMKWLNNELDK